jgi:hypothetical protein
MMSSPKPTNVGGASGVGAALLFAAPVLAIAAYFACLGWHNLQSYETTKVLVLCIVLGLLARRLLCGRDR